MNKRSSVLSIESANMSVVVLTPQPRFRAEWVYAFRDPGMGLMALPPMARVTLWDIICLAGVTPEGLLAVPMRKLAGYGVGRTTRYTTLGLLEERGLIVKGKDGLIYLSPEITYRGRASRWTDAWNRWLTMRGEEHCPSSE